jgi:hypothetical protein
MGPLGQEWIAERGGPKGLTRKCLQRRTSSGTWAAALNHFRGSWMGAAARSFAMRWCRRCTLHAARLAPWQHGRTAARRECALWGKEGGICQHQLATPQHHPRAYRGRCPRCCVEAAASLSGARAPGRDCQPSHLGHDCQPSWTSWTLAATRLIFHHGPL